MLLDIAFGVLLGSYFSVAYFDTTIWVIVLGVVCALLPDIDFVFEYLYSKNRRFSFLRKLAHRGILHTPMFYIAVAGILFLSKVSIILIVMFLIGVTFHLLHDLFVLGRGVMVAFPFSNYRLKLFPDNGSDGYLRKKILWWDETKTPLYTYNDYVVNDNNLHNENWIHIWYMKPNWFLFSELLLMVVFVYCTIAFFF